MSRTIGLFTRNHRMIQLYHSQKKRRERYVHQLMTRRCSLSLSLSLSVSLLFLRHSDNKIVDFSFLVEFPAERRDMNDARTTASQAKKPQSLTDVNMHTKENIKTSNRRIVSHSLFLRRSKKNRHTHTDTLRPVVVVQ